MVDLGATNSVEVVRPVGIPHFGIAILFCNLVNRSIVISVFYTRGGGKCKNLRWTVGKEPISL